MKKTFKHNEFTATFTDEDGYFSLTGHYQGGSGAISKSIAEIDNRFKLLDEMHLADCKTGAPMHALENGFYHFQKNLESNKPEEYPWIPLENYWNVNLNGAQQSRIVANLEFKLGKFNLKKTTAVSIAPNGEKLFCSTKDIVTQIMDEIKPLWKQKAADVYKLVESIPSDLTEEDEDFDPEDEFDEPEKARALAQFMEIDCSAISQDYGNYFNVSGKMYLVVNDDEADTLWDESLDNYIDDCMEIPEQMENYFDRDAWKRDARMDGRGHCLSSYDGCENYEDDPETGETFYIYQN